MLGCALGESGCEVLLEAIPALEVDLGFGLLSLIEAMRRVCNPNLQLLLSVVAAILNCIEFCWLLELGLGLVEVQRLVREVRVAVYLVESDVLVYFYRTRYQRLAGRRVVQGDTHRLLHLPVGVETLLIFYLSSYMVD